MYGLISVGVVLLVKSTGVFNFANGSLAAIGAYIFWSLLVLAGIPLIFSVACLVMACALLAALIERMAMRPLIGQPLLAAIMVTIGLGEVFSGIVILAWPGTGRNFTGLLPQGNINALGVVLSQENLGSLIVVLIALVIFAFFFRQTKLGLAMRGVSENHKLAQSAGIRVTGIFAVSWFIAVLMSSTAGILVANISSLDADAIHFFGMKAFAVVILGGLESIGGAVLAGLIVGLVEMLTSGYLDPLVGGGLSGVMPIRLAMERYCWSANRGKPTSKNARNKISMVQ